MHLQQSARVRVYGLLFYNPHVQLIFQQVLILQRCRGPNSPEHVTEGGDGVTSEQATDDDCIQPSG